VGSKPDAEDQAVEILERAQRIEVFEAGVDIDAEVASEHPKVFTKIHITYKFWGEGLKEANIEKAINLSQERYCSVTAMLNKAVKITHSYKINPEK